MHIQPTPRKKPQPGLLHEYAERLVAFEYASSPTNGIKPHTLLFIGGLGDGLGTVDYLTDIIAALEETAWSVFSPVLSSAYGGWGMSGLGKDIDEIGLCVNYIRDYKSSIEAAAKPGKIVLMGHSTGSQDVMQYISSANPRPPQPPLVRHPILRPRIDGAIMQAPVSDRQAIQSALQEGNERFSPGELQKIYADATARAKQRPFETYDSLDTIVPLPVTACIGYPETTVVSSRRFLSLVSPESPRFPGEDDLFSSDLGEERLRKTFGMVGSRGVLGLGGKLLVLYSGRDPSVPGFVDKEGLVERWRRVTEEGERGQGVWHCESGIIPGASHTLSGRHQVEQRGVLVRKVMRFLSDTEL
ncbi:hypothetical protein BJX99DRAFT_272389 [Aspergillus californicus]